MTYVLIYLLKVSLAISLVTIPYYLWLRQDAALNVKRFYMTGGIILSWLFPLIVIKKPEAIASFNEVYFIDPYTVSSSASSSGTLAETGNGISFTIFSLVIGIYLTGLIILALRHFFMLRKLKGIDRHNDQIDQSIIYTNTREIFTLFSKIFVPNDLKSSKDLDSILIHEKAHLQQLHMIDLIIAETNLLLTWFNPFSWLISRMIKENHEHLADRTVLLKGVNPAHYKAQLLNHSVGVELFRLGNQFNHSLTKKRFQMMKKIKSPKKGFIKYLALVPAIIIALGLFTAASAQQKTIHGQVVFEDGSPATGASIVVVGSTTGSVVDRKGTFSLDVEGNPELAISFVGFKTVRIHANELAKKDVVLYPKTFEIDLKDVEASKLDYFPFTKSGADKVEINIDEKGNANKVIITSNNKTGKSEGITIKSSADSDGNKPVFVVDGKVVEDIESLNPDNIKSIAVVKDSDSPQAKKYNAENGVIIVKMKDTKAAKSKEKKEKKKPAQEVEISDKPIFFIVEDMPSFPLGRDGLKAYIIKNLEYPAKAKEKKMSGVVNVQATVTTSGALEDIKAVKSSDKIFEEAAVKVFEGMPDWNPGMQRGKPVSVTINVPVRFNPEQE